MSAKNTRIYMFKSTRAVGFYVTRLCLDKFNPHEEAFTSVARAVGHEEDCLKMIEDGTRQACFQQFAGYPWYMPATPTQQPKEQS